MVLYLVGPDFQFGFVGAVWAFLLGRVGAVCAWAPFARSPLRSSLPQVADLDFP